MIKLMIGEMEDTLVELKAACAQAMADQARLGRQQAELEGKAALWRERAQLAARKDRAEGADIAKLMNTG